LRERLSALARRPWDGWSRFWFAEIDGTAFGLVRILFSAAAILTLLEFAPLLREQYTDEGVFHALDAMRWSWGNAMAVFLRPALGSLGAVVVIYTALLFALGFLLVGRFTRLAAAAVFALQLWFQLRNPTYLNGGDEVLRLTAFYLFLGHLVVPPEGRAFSLDRARALARRGLDEATAAPPRMPAWPVRMIQLQVCIIYFLAGFWKLLGDSWWNGDAIYVAIGNASITRFGPLGGAWSWPLYWVAGLFVAWWEFLFPLLVLTRWGRRFSIAHGIALHLGILLTMNIGFFSLVMLATYPVFVDPAWARRTVLRRFGGLGRAALHWFGPRPRVAPGRA